MFSEDTKVLHTGLQRKDSASGWLILAQNLHTDKHNQPVFRTIVCLEAFPLSCSVFAVYECVGLQHVCVLICIVSASLFACGLLATVFQGLLIAIAVTKQKVINL